MNIDIDRDLYPFEQRRHDRGAGISLHYLDEGPKEGAPVVMVHGNPSWSIYFRSLILALRDRYRCIVPDHVGMGLSDRPDDRSYDYTLRSRIDDLEGLLESLNVTSNITLVLHDWGGAIGMGYATRHPERVSRLVISNTAAFHLPRGKAFPAALALVRTPLGGLLVRRANAFARAASFVCTKKRRLSPRLRQAYIRPYQSYEDSLATLRFVEDIPLREGDRSYSEISRIERGLEHFRNTPCLVFWGMKDFVFDAHFLAEWETRMPHAEVHRFEQAGHYVLEDEEHAVSTRVRTWLDEARSSS